MRINLSESEAIIRRNFQTELIRSFNPNESEAHPKKIAKPNEFEGSIRMYPRLIRRLEFIRIGIFRPNSYRNKKESVG